MTKEILERAMGIGMEVPRHKKSPRESCHCLLGNDIGMYNTCGHGCVYCYANYNQEIVQKNSRQHHPDSPFLIGRQKEGDRIHEAKQTSYIDGQLSLF
jgi:hypothetical protein